MQIRPVIRWAGSKRRLLPTILKAAPSKFGRYLEPFAGSAIVFLSLNPQSAILNDLNEELIRTYRTLRNGSGDVARALRDFPKDKHLYYFLRAIPANTLDPVTRAARFIYLNRYSFNAVYRTNRRGEFNVPMGTHSGRRPSPSGLRKFAERLRTAELYHDDFEGIVNEADRDDFVYLDPPYSSRPERFYGEYGYDSFAAIDEGRLVRSVRAADRRGARVLISYNKNLVPQFRDWRVREVRVKRSVAGFNRSRKSVTEVLISNY